MVERETLPQTVCICERRVHTRTYANALANVLAKVLANVLARRIRKSSIICAHYKLRAQSSSSCFASTVDDDRQWQFGRVRGRVAARRNYARENACAYLGQCTHMYDVYDMYHVCSVCVQYVQSAHQPGECLQLHSHNRRERASAIMNMQMIILFVSVLLEILYESHLTAHQATHNVQMQPTKQQFRRKFDCQNERLPTTSVRTSSATVATSKTKTCLTFNAFVALELVREVSARSGGQLI